MRATNSTTPYSTATTTSRTMQLIHSSITMLTTSHHISHHLTKSTLSQTTLRTMERRLTNMMTTDQYYKRTHLGRIHTQILHTMMRITSPHLRTIQKKLRLLRVRQVP